MSAQVYSTAPKKEGRK